MAWTVGVSWIWALSNPPTHAENVIAFTTLAVVCIIQSILLCVLVQKQNFLNIGNIRENPDNHDQRANDLDTPRQRKEGQANFHTFSSEQKSEDEQHRAEERGFWKRQIRVGWWLNGITGVAAAIALAGIGVLLGQQRIMQRQLNDTEIQEAASISLRNFSIAGFPDKPTITVDVVNTGKSRADWISIIPVAAWVSGPDVTKLINQQAQGLGTIRPNKFGFSLESTDPPRHVVTQTQSLPPVPPEGIPPLKEVPTREEFISGNVSTMIYVIAAYRDVFGNTHSVVDCGAHFPAGGASFISCFAGNRHYDQQ
jgi:hypothetical protein